jgi:thiol-disulfide isomerase/thioredoxin
MKTLLYPILALLLVGCDASPEPGKSGLEALRGRWAVINYWAEWCAPCIREIPELNELARQYPDVAVMGVNYDGATGEDLARQVETLGVGFPNLSVDPARELGNSRPAVLPTTLILDPEGRLVTTLVGPQTLESLVDAVGQSIKKPAHRAG